METPPTDSQPSGARPNARQTSRLAIVLAVIVALIGARVLLYCSANGAGISPDSVHYIQMARSFAAGQGFCTESRNMPGVYVIERHWPPFYPILLSSSLLIGEDPQDWARWLGALFFAANIFLVGFSIHRYMRAAWLAVLGAALMASIEAVLQAHYYAWSEPPFVFLCLIALLAFGGYVARPRISPLLIAAVAVSLAFVTRLAGAALLFTGAISLLFLMRENVRRRVRDLVIFLAASCLPIILWTIRNLAFAGTTADRRRTLHFPTARIVEGGLTNISRWFLPAVPKNPSALRDPANWFSADWTAPSDAATWAALIVGVIVVLLIAVLFIFRTRTPAPAESAAPEEPAAPALNTNLLIFGIFAGVYLVMIVAVSTFFDPPIPLEKRLLIPFLISGIVLVLCAGYAGTMRRPILRAALVIACLFLIYMHVASSRWWVQGRHVHGLGYEAPIWRQELKYIEDLPEGQVVYSNNETAVIAVTRRPAARIPAKRSNLRGERRSAFLELADNMTRTLRQKGGVIVFFAKEGSPDPSLPTAQELSEVVPLRHVLDLKNDLVTIGSVYVLAEQPASPASGNHEPAPQH